MGNLANVETPGWKRKRVEFESLLADAMGKPTGDPDIVLRDGTFFTFGKSTACDVTLRHGSISRMHAALLLLDDGMVYLLDLQSSYGSKLNDKQKLKALKAAEGGSG